MEKYKKALELKRAGKSTAEACEEAGLSTGYFYKLSGGRKRFPKKQRRSSVQPTIIPMQRDGFEFTSRQLARFVRDLVEEIGGRQ